MSYIRPSEVISPKDKVSDVRVIVEGGPGDSSVALLNYDGVKSVGVRWNGTDGSRVGNPQSRGVGTWFILPEKLAALVLSGLGGDLDHGSGITRVSVYPTPRRIKDGVLQQSRDDDWILGFGADGAIEINDIQTGHRIVLERGDVKSLTRDRTAETEDGPRRGRLELNVRIKFEDGEASKVAESGLKDRIAELLTQLLEDGYEGYHDHVRTVIDETRIDLGVCGPWETELLDSAAAAVDSNFLRLALVSVDKAIDVNGLTPQEYEQGLNYGKR